MRRKKIRRKDELDVLKLAFVIIALAFCAVFNLDCRGHLPVNRDRMMDQK